MRKLYGNLLAILIIAVLAVVPAHATYSGLLIIPTTDIVENGQYCIEAQVDWPTSDFESGDTYILNTQFGFGGNFEAGVDFDLSKDADPRVLFNWKYRFQNNEKSGLSMAAGVYSHAVHIKSTPYIVATQDLRAFRLHFGGARIESNNRWFVGADVALGDRWTLMADYTSGDENFSSAGFNYQFNDAFGLMAGLQFPNNRQDSNIATVHFVFTGPFRSTH